MRAIRRGWIAPWRSLARSELALRVSVCRAIGSELTFLKRPACRSRVRTAMHRTTLYIMSVVTVKSRRTSCWNRPDGAGCPHNVSGAARRQVRGRPQLHGHEMFRFILWNTNVHTIFVCTERLRERENVFYLFRKGMVSRNSTVGNLPVLNINLRCSIKMCHT